MDIRSGLDGLKSLLGVTQATAAQSQQVKSGGSTETSGMGSDRATLSSAASQVAESASEGGVRMDKVSAIQSALAAGTYSVPASMVASKMVDAMLAGN